MKLSTLFAAALVAAAFAGCADNAATPTPATAAPATATPTPDATPTATPPPATPTHEMGTTPPDCDEPTATPQPLGTNMGYPELVVTVEEPSADDACFQFVALDEVEAGWTAITLRNNGMSPHIMPMYYIGTDRTVDELIAAIAASETGEAPAWAQAVGGVGFVTPFQSGTILMDLQEGTYVLVCFFDGHHMHGMYRALNVTHPEGEHEELDAPAADLTIKAFDYGFETPANLTNGTYIVKFVNNGTEVHEAPLIQLNANTTLAQFLAAIEEPAGPPPGAGIGGANRIDAGQEAYAIVTFAAGNYGLLCFVSSPAHGGAPHLALGMQREFSVA